MEFDHEDDHFYYHHYLHFWRYLCFWLPGKTELWKLYCFYIINLYENK